MAPTPPPAPTAHSDVHLAALHGFGQQAEAYVRGRPEYPAALQDWLRDALGLHAGQRVLDLGAGTGKFTRRLLATGASVCAVEPVEAMRAQLVQALPEVQALPGRAEALPLPDASVDAVVCAQAFHWFANAQALAEMRRVLRPGGRLGLVWNVRDTREPWMAEVSALLGPYEGDAPRHHRGDWQRVFEAGCGFSPLRLSRHEHRHAGAFEDVVLNRFLSVSFIAALPAAERARVRAALEALRPRHAALRADPVVAPYVTEAWVSERVAPP